MVGIDAGGRRWRSFLRQPLIRRNRQENNAQQKAPQNRKMYSHSKVRSSRKEVRIPD
jgi:hypothetical protein